MIERKFDKDEILQALQSSNGDKAPGQDEFTMGFLKKCWRVVMSDVMAVLRNFMISVLLRNLSMLPSLPSYLRNRMLEI